ncbi:hypothetical protein [Winogradskyella alexanderae]|uniref:Uncharacterized protein n=1 Tax=Winogradskyella alexanderae TaxID=2877123 RepID=A0ABS7XT99_9FLAO|nr:hypothetical protein [Winogradskyella alexanderae]MCA0133248.1 hypothetical protein [Winogradskyella alexanderae]
MKHFCFSVLVCLLLFSCQNKYNKNIKAFHFIPEESSLVLKINSYSEFKNAVETNAIISAIYNKDIKPILKITDTLVSTSPIYVSILENELNKNRFVIISERSDSSLTSDSLNDSRFIIEEGLIQKTSVDTLQFYFRNENNLILASNDSSLLSSLRIKKEISPISDLLQTTNTTATASMVIDVSNPDYSKLLFIDRPQEGYLTVDLNINSKGITHNGILINKDSIPNVLNNFRNTIPQRISSPQIAPMQTSELTSVAFNDFPLLDLNTNNDSSQVLNTTETFLNYCDEIASVDNAIILHSLDPNLLMESIDGKSFEESFREIAIYNFKNPDYFSSKLKPLLSYSNASYLFSKDNFVVFSNSIETLKEIISDYLNGKTLAKYDAFQNIEKQLSDESSLFVYKNETSLSKIFATDVKDYQANAVQYVYENGFAHVNGVIQKFEKQNPSNTISELFSTVLENQIIAGPQTLVNHLNKTRDIAVQDVNNNLYLISNSGGILWKKKLQDKIIGNIEQIDIYKNGRLQLAFATSKRVYVLDRNGNDVGPFPLKFNDKITQPLSVFDYDNKKNYRLLVTQSDNLLMYNTKGKSVVGFKYKAKGGTITTQPKHFRINSKDYIVFASGEELKILSRRGSLRIPITQKFRFSDNAIFVYKNKFTTTNTLGELIQVNTKGQITRTNLNLTENHKIDATSRTLVSLDDNKLTIRSKTVNLDFGDYTPPKILYLNDKLYITTTDLQSKKVYLFDSQAAPIPNFPVYGISSAILAKLDSDKKLELITLSDANSVLTYKLN